MATCLNKVKKKLTSTLTSFFNIRSASSWFSKVIKPYLWMTKRMGLLKSYINATYWLFFLSIKITFIFFPLKDQFSNVPYFKYIKYMYMTVQFSINTVCKLIYCTIFFFFMNNGQNNCNFIIKTLLICFIIKALCWCEYVTKIILLFLFYPLDTPALSAIILESLTAPYAEKNCLSSWSVV